eukprot:NODE_15906_length_223_cov_1.672619.p2 GENE.NODE_15906_length_223_cov_1.672619~~NODE_15906_length_223_cov_1.672619.p2  ORF type:complete len:61 (-),score=5.70 NODE_15906_length_223_cov_1.672619:20-202(-)
MGGTQKVRQAPRSTSPRVLINRNLGECGELRRSTGRVLPRAESPAKNSSYHHLIIFMSFV